MSDPWVVPENFNKFLRLIFFSKCQNSSFVVLFLARHAILCYVCVGPTPKWCRSNHWPYTGTQRRTKCGSVFEEQRKRDETARRHLQRRSRWILQRQVPLPSLLSIIIIISLCVWQENVPSTPSSKINTFINRDRRLQIEMKPKISFNV